MPSLTATMPSVTMESPISTNGQTPLPTSKQLLTLDQVPEWKKTNPHILTGYRPISYSYKACLASWTFIHNETMNTYSHLLLVLPVALLLVRAGLVLTGKVESLTAPRTADILVFGVFFLGALACMGFSAAYHTLMCHSQAVADLTRQFDYMGITCLIYGSFVPTIYYIFTCETELMRTYMMTVRWTLQDFPHMSRSLTWRAVHRDLGDINYFLRLATRTAWLDCSPPNSTVCSFRRIRSGTAE